MRVENLFHDKTFSSEYWKLTVYVFLALKFDQDLAAGLILFNCVIHHG